MFISPCGDVNTNWALSRAQANLMLELAVRPQRDAETASLFPLHLLPNDIAYSATGLPSLPVAAIMNEQCALLRVPTSPQGASPQAVGVHYRTRS